MTVAIYGKYIGNLGCEITHEPSGQVVPTSAPKDVGGSGGAISPTDMLAASLGACVVTTMAIAAEKKGIALSGAHFRVVKHMIADPRRIGKLEVEVHLPKSIPQEARPRLEAFGHSCPVHKSLHPDVEAPILFVYDVEG
jgi:putative redox protein